MSAWIPTLMDRMDTFIIMLQKCICELWSQEHGLRPRQRWVSSPLSTSRRSYSCRLASTSWLRTASPQVFVEALPSAGSA
jgi:hypothetical protein